MDVFPRLSSLGPRVACALILFFCLGGLPVATFLIPRIEAAPYSPDSDHDSVTSSDDADHPGPSIELGAEVATPPYDHDHDRDHDHEHDHSDRTPSLQRPGSGPDTTTQHQIALFNQLDRTLRDHLEDLRPRVLFGRIRLSLTRLATRTRQRLSRLATRLREPPRFSSPSAPDHHDHDHSHDGHDHDHDHGHQPHEALRTSLWETDASDLGLPPGLTPHDVFASPLLTRHDDFWDISEPAELRLRQQTQLGALRAGSRFFDSATLSRQLRDDWLRSLADQKELTALAAEHHIPSNSLIRLLHLFYGHLAHLAYHLNPRHIAAQVEHYFYHSVRLALPHAAFAVVWEALESYAQAWGGFHHNEYPLLGLALASGVTHFILDIPVHMTNVAIFGWRYQQLQKTRLEELQRRYSFTTESLAQQATMSRAELLVDWTLDPVLIGRTLVIPDTLAELYPERFLAQKKAVESLNGEVVTDRAFLRGRSFRFRTPLEREIVLRTFDALIVDSSASKVSLHQHLSPLDHALSRSYAAYVDMISWLENLSTNRVAPLEMTINREICVAILKDLLRNRWSEVKSLPLKKFLLDQIDSLDEWLLDITDTRRQFRSEYVHLYYRIFKEGHFPSPENASLVGDFFQEHPELVEYIARMATERASHSLALQRKVVPNSHSIDTLEDLRDYARSTISDARRFRSLVERPSRETDLLSRLRTRFGNSAPTDDLVKNTLADILRRIENVHQNLDQMAVCGSVLTRVRPTTPASAFLRSVARSPGQQTPQPDESNPKAE